MCSSNDRPRSYFTAGAIAFELSLGLLAVGLGWLTGFWPWEPVAPHWAWHAAGSQVVAGTLLALLLFAGLVALDHRPFWIFRHLQHQLHDQVIPLFRGLHPLSLLGISLSAGICEELLFRGYCQRAFELWSTALLPIWPSLTALLLASALFGLCHAISPAYALATTLVGMLLGATWLVTGDLLAPIDRARPLRLPGVDLSDACRGWRGRARGGSSAPVAWGRWRKRKTAVRSD